MEAQIRGRAPVKLIGGMVLMVVLLLIGYHFGSGTGGLGGSALTVNDAQQCEAHGANTFFTVTFGTDSYLSRIGLGDAIKGKDMAQAFIITANTHVGDISKMNLNNKIFLAEDGVTYSAVADPQDIGEHHNLFLVLFPRYDKSGRPLFTRQDGSFDILIKNIEFPERVLHFNFPLEGMAGPTTRKIVAMFATALAALLLACTPCLMGSLLTGALTMGVAGSSGASDNSGVRARLRRQTLTYLASQAVAYVLVSVVVIEFRLASKMLLPFEMLGGAVLLLVGLGFLREWVIVARLERRLAAGLARLSPVFKPYAEQQAARTAMTEEGSAALGGSLALTCSVAGAPILSSSILIPVMAYAGINTLGGVVGMLVVYLLVSSVPFFFIGVGLGEWLLNAAMRWRRRMMVFDGFLLVGLGLLFLSSGQTVANIISYPAEWFVQPVIWLLTKLGVAV